MCGITGFYLPQPDSSHFAHRLCAGRLLTHRGPDSFKNWVNSERTVAFQHYRLAIVDLSSAGAQPMQSSNGRWVIAFNGEIYNHLDIRRRLDIAGAAPSWRGHSDTETLLAAISAWGLRKTLDICVGMFVFALYDSNDKSLSLVRDRLGEKPLYYGYLAGALCFASEPKALRAARGSLSLHMGAIAAYMRLGYISGPQSVYEGIFRLQPGTILMFTEADIGRELIPQPLTYWNLLVISGENSSKKDLLTNQNALNRFDDVMRSSIRGQMLADVPLGAFLSGGIDSSLIVSLMQAQSTQPIRTFSIGFEDSTADEAPYARRIAEHLGTMHTELYVSSADVMNLIPRLPAIFCEPFADSSQVPALLVSQLARSHVTVALTGDGGDELFAGYDRYHRIKMILSLFDVLPLGMRKMVSKLIHRMPVSTLNSLANALGNPGGALNPADRLKKIAGILPARSLSELNLGFLTLWEPSFIMPNSTEIDSVYSKSLPSATSDIESLMLADLLCYLPDDLLVKVDRASMAMGLECRAPFLDHRVIEFALSMTLDQKMMNGQPKGLLKELLSLYLPKSLFDRPKQGFGMPINVWLRGPLREWARNMIYGDTINSLGFINVNGARQMLEEHLNEERNWQHQLWTLLMLLAWIDHNK